MSFFTMPVNENALSDYSVYVRNPIDLSTIKYKLDGTLPTDVRTCNAINRAAAHRYTFYSEFISDLKRVFANALKYNKMHLEEDITGLSKEIYAAAELLQVSSNIHFIPYVCTDKLIFICMIQTKLDGLLPALTVSLADKIERNKITSNESAQRDHERAVKRQKEEEQARIFENQKLAELKVLNLSL